MDNIAPINIGNNVYIGTGAFIMPGVSIEDNCIIGANAVVTHDIPGNSVAVGVPAKVIENIELYYKHLVEKGRLFPTEGMNFKEKREYIESKLLSENGLRDTGNDQIRQKRPK